MTPLSGHQYELHGHGYTAVIASVGASLRRLVRHDPGTAADRDLVVPFDADVLRPAYRGATLAPWPNRVTDGRYAFDGTEHQLALTEPARGHALHGLVAWADFTATELADDRVGLITHLPAQQGYPFPVSVAVTFALGPDGLTSTVTGTNLGTVDAPWGTGPHPYLVAGPGRVDDWTLTLPAHRVLTVTPDRLVPTGLEPVEEHDGGALDFTAGRTIGNTFVDHAFTALDRDADGRATVEVRTTGGPGVAMSFGPECPWVQVHTADLDDPALSRIGLAVEPMTCAPDAYNDHPFNPGAGLVRLAPGGAHTAAWTITARD
ncbi:aldose 1-epimerase [Friedmanniella endophytica]|uniref:Aldose 1-epimerase n=1 Tax=Microlunatus kandeliicorticis TaxID=1759536 RepID=A0A7W3IRX6_9ACTN|nr:aldose 1-epimerase family protein [Microlunatus kandeliicorticis]MBA8794153.1 aldose 1-epimerase [Microlunatus kandeliicorticis]